MAFLQKYMPLNETLQQSSRLHNTALSSPTLNNMIGNALTVGKEKQGNIDKCVAFGIH